MAKIMVSLPDELLERIDARARSAHETRSGYLRDLAERDLEAGTIRDREFAAELLGEGVPLGGDTALIIRRDRLSH